MSLLTIDNFKGKTMRTFLIFVALILVSNLTHADEVLSRLEALEKKVSVLEAAQAHNQKESNYYFPQYEGSMYAYTSNCAELKHLMSRIVDPRISRMTMGYKLRLTGQLKCGNTVYGIVENPVYSNARSFLVDMNSISKAP
jgi:hypothetical protein